MLEDIKEDQLLQILRWRNNELVRRAMFTDHEITQEEHFTWWNRVKDDPTKCYKIYYYNKCPAGFVSFYDIDLGSSQCFWGFYLADDLKLSRVEKFKLWLDLEKEAIDFTFNVLTCKSLLCSVFDFNRVVINMHEKFGFKKTGEFQKLKSDKLQQVFELKLDYDSYRKEFELKKNGYIASTIAREKIENQLTLIYQKTFPNLSSSDIYNVRMKDYSGWTISRYMRLITVVERTFNVYISVDQLTKYIDYRELLSFLVAERG